MPPRVSRARRAKDKRKAKRWYRVLTQKELGDVELDSALATSPESLVGRIVRSSGQSFSGDFSKGHMRLFFKVEKTEGDDAIAVFIGHESGSDYMRGLVRRRRSRIDAIVERVTKDGYKIKVHPVVITRQKINESQRKAVRDEATSQIGDYLEGTTLGEFFHDLLSTKVAREVQSRCKRIAPIGGVELVRSNVKRVEGELDQTKEELEEPAGIGEPKPNESGA